MPTSSLPPELAALASQPSATLRAVALRIDAVTLARIAALRDRLNRPSRGALLRFLIGEGLRSVEAQLRAAAAETVIHTEP